MEASLPAITPAPVTPPKSPAQKSSATETASPFSDFLDAATTDNAPQDAQESVDPEISASTSSQQEVMAAELTALSFQEIPALQVSQIIAGQETPITSSGITDSLSPATPDTPAIPATPATPVIPASPELNALQQMITMPADDPLTTTLPTVETAREAGEKVPPTEPLGINTPKNTSLLTQQIESILNGDPRNTIAVQTTAQPAPNDSLNGLTSPYLQSATEFTAMSKPPATKTSVDVDGKLTTDAGKSLRDNMGERSLDTKIEGISDQRSSGKQQQETGQQDNNANQQNTFTIPLPLSHSNSDPASQFIVTGLGTQTAVTTPGQTSGAQPTSLPPGAQVPAEELINHLVERFSINPRLQTSKISLNLNPAELGALKIDILVKGDSIKAHIAAGNQQIQETIEKNMPKLRTILEQQGFTVEDFKVTLESSNSSSNDFFQQQFSSRQDSSPEATPVSSMSSFELSLNSAEELLIAPSMDSGINLSI
jgi:flagellar hook-length control protein FliK